MIAQGAAVFLLCKGCLRDHPIRSGKLRAAIRFLAQDTLGIYLAHPLILALLTPVPMPASVGLTIMLRSLLVFAVSAATVSVLRMIPILRHTVS